MSGYDDEEYTPPGFRFAGAVLLFFAVLFLVLLLTNCGAARISSQPTTAALPRAEQAPESEQSNARQKISTPAESSEPRPPAARRAGRKSPKIVRARGRNETEHKSAPSDAKIRSALIKQSLLGYYGSCPCPYNTDRAGRRCGKRSAYSRPGGASPLCFPHEISPEMIKTYRAATKN